MLWIQANSGLWDVRPEGVTDRGHTGSVGSRRKAEESASADGEDRLTN